MQKPVTLKAYRVRVVTEVFVRPEWADIETITAKQAEALATWKLTQMGADVWTDTFKITSVKRAPEHDHTYDAAYYDE